MNYRLVHLDWSRKPLSLLLALTIATSAALGSAVGLFEPVEDALTAHRAEFLSRQPTGQTAIVEIDGRSLAELRSWPWPRRYHAQVVRELHEAGASIIAFDVDFSARSAGGDEELAAAIREAGHVVLPIFEQRASGREGDDRLLASRPDKLFSDAWVGGVNIFPDSDGMVRTYPAATLVEGNIQPSIATLVAEKNGLGDRSFEPDWAIEAGRIPRFSFADVMHGRVPANELRGKRFLIGATAIELGDRYPVPRFGMVPGVVVQALATESLLQNRAVQRTGSLVTLFGILLIASLLAPGPLERRWRYAILCGTVVLAIVTVPVVAHWFWPVSVDSAVWIFTAFAAIAVQIIIEAHRRLRFHARVDAESGLPNRAVLEMELCAPGEGASVLVAAAIERFESIRDGIGLAATNEMIRNTADAVSKLVGGAVHRIAPDTIAWVQPGGEAEVQSMLSQIQAEFRSSVATKAGPVDVMFTVGLENDDGSAAAVLRIERSLSAISSARALGKSHDWHRGADVQPRRQLSMMGDLRDAMAKGRLRLAYQAKMELATGRIGDAEALIRWADDAGKTISPDEFIPLAEATGAIREVTSFALRSAAVDLARWARAGVAMRVAVNVSALDLATPDFANNVDRILSEFDVPPSQFTLEVTESALIRSPAEAIATLTSLRERGIRLAVDDYGTGQSTLSYVKHLPVHELKIDKSFVTTVTNSESDSIMVRSTINLAHDLGLQVVAEGIEDQATLHVLRQMGCDYAQGYFISKPVGADELLQLIRSESDPRLVA